jgi:hypothetical protein
MEDAMLRHGGAAGLELGDEVAEAINDETWSGLLLTDYELLSFRCYQKTAIFVQSLGYCWLAQAPSLVSVSGCVWEKLQWVLSLIFNLLSCVPGPPLFAMLEQTVNFLGWNVRGLNDQDRKDTVHETIAASTCRIVCLQETKLERISSFDACYIGGNR